MTSGWMPRELAILPLLLLLGACVGGSGRPQQAPRPAAPPHGTTVPRPTADPAPPPVRFYAPKIMNAPGLENIIGSDVAGLIRQYGQPRLDLREGDARKLQFSGAPCVLDIFLYPLRPGAEPTATWVETRRASDGQDVDRAACARALARRP